MLRRDFLQLAAGAAFQAARPAPPNVCVIVTDDQGVGDVGCFGASDMKTPNLDRLAAGGVRFTNWHANSPVCSPSRASVLTGKYPQRAGIPEILFSRASFDVPGLKRGERTLAGELRTLGYRTAAVGKWHLGSAPDSRPLAQGSTSSSASTPAGSITTRTATTPSAASLFTTISGGTSGRSGKSPSIRPSC
jgi:arylsulfatase A-like enzyme